MSAFFGRCNFDDQPVNEARVRQIGLMLSAHGPDSEGSFYSRTVAIIHRALQTTPEAIQETQPHILSSGTVIAWDGRLDNRQELVSQLEQKVSNSSSDPSIVAAAFERWGVKAFAKVTGDWAIAVCDPHAHSVILARDQIGIRPLYYTMDAKHVSWSTLLDPLVLFSDKQLKLDEEYLAGWLAFFPAAHLTPYVGICSVPPSSFVCLRQGQCSTSKYWDFDSGKQIRHRDDSGYEEHFRAVLSQSVRRRLRSNSPVLAELSGGIDSSSIVCVADTLIARGGVDTPRLDTLSYYDDSEPNWDEQPYLTRVESRRGRSGCHIDVSQTDAPLDYCEDCFSATPGSEELRTESGRRFTACLMSQGNRVLLSGTGGDEILGGVPIPTPELADLAARARVGRLVHQLVAWAIAKRKPILNLAADTLRAFLPICWFGGDSYRRPASWLGAEFLDRYKDALSGYDRRLKVFGPRPSFQENLSTLEMLRRQLGCATPASAPPYEKRFPYLDRDLLEFVYAIPRDQVLRPHQRRSLMRRALVGIVPDEILNRKRKAFVVRGPKACISRQSKQLLSMTRNMVSGSLGMVDPILFGKTLEQLQAGQDIPIVPLLRTIQIEYWLQHLKHFKVLPASMSAGDCLSREGCVFADQD